MLISNLLYAESLVHFWDNGYWKPVTVLVALPFAALAAAGYVGRCRRGATSFEVFVPLYTAVILSWPAMQGLRFLMPILPCCSSTASPACSILGFALGRGWSGTSSRR